MARQGEHIRQVAYSIRDSRLSCTCLVLAILAVTMDQEGRTAQVGSPQSHSALSDTLIRVPPVAQKEIAVEPAQTLPIEQDLVLPGRIQYAEDGFARISSPVAGLVKEVHAKLGDKISEGQVLLVIESPDLGAAFSDFAKAKSNLQLAKQNYERVRDLYSTHAIAKKDFVQAQNDLVKSEAEYLRARQRLLSLKVPKSEFDRPHTEQEVRDRFELRSPLRGAVVERNVTPGQLVQSDPNQVLYTVANLDVLQATPEIYERDVHLLSTGMAAEVTVESLPQERFSATVAYVGDIVDPYTRTIKLRCYVRNFEHKLKPGMFARVHIHVRASAHAVTIPREAVIEVGNATFVFVARSATEYEQRPVLIGVTSDDLVEVQEGLQPGDRVVVKGALLLKGALEK